MKKIIAIKPEREFLLKTIEEKKKIWDCISFFKCGYKTFKKWIEEYGIEYDFTKNKYSNVKRLHSLEVIKKRSESKKNNNRKKINCLNCSKQIEITKKSNKKFCSENCWYDYKSKKEKNKKEVICEFCNKIILKYPSLIKVHNFCSYECSNKYREGKTFDDMYGVEKSNEIKNRIRISTSANNKFNPTYFTKPHKKLKDAMIEHCIYDGFETSESVDYWEIDELNKKEKICLEIDGDYWHNIDYVRTRDKRKNLYLKEKGYTVIRFWEHEINNEIEKCIDKLKNILKK